MTPFDPVRAGDWLHAVEQWNRGDARAVAGFVLAHGVQTDDERRAVADMLATPRPDARRATKATTAAMLRDVARMLDRRQRDLGHLRQWAQRLRLRLAARGCTDEQITQALRERRPGYCNCVARRTPKFSPPWARATA